LTENPPFLSYPFLRKILLLGSGFVAAPVVGYLLRREENFVTIGIFLVSSSSGLYALNRNRIETIGSAHLKNAQALQDKYPKDRTAAIAIDVENSDSLDAQVKEHDLIIRFPFPPCSKRYQKKKRKKKL